MPHSSGGGSHGGGHHSSSHHSSSGSRGSRSVSPVSEKPYLGARCYRYRRRGRTRYFYSDRDPQTLFFPARLLLGLFYIPFLIVIPLTIKTEAAPFFKHYEPTVLIKDEADVLKEKAGLEQALETFYEKSGIPTAVVTVNNEDWQDKFYSLEDYAYNRYLVEFDDEMHWLIVYSEPKESNAAEPEWYWEGMQGDDTDRVLTERVTARFNADLQSRLENPAGSTEDDLAQAFLAAAETTKKLGIGSLLSALAPMLFALAFILFHAYFMLGLNNLKYRKATLVTSEEAPQELAELNRQKQIYEDAHATVICRYCGTAQFASRKYCASCGAYLETYQPNSEQDYYHEDQ